MSDFPDPIPGIIPFGTITLLAGPSQLGKTAMIASWCVRWRDGKTICGRPTTQPTSMGVIVADRKQASHKAWFEKAGWPDIPMYSFRDDPSTKWDDFLVRQRLRGLLIRGLDKLAAQGIGAGSLIIVDPLSPFIAGNLMDYKQSLVGVAQLDQICAERRITIMGIVHMSKQKGDTKDQYRRPQDRILGSAALGGFTDTQMYMIGPEDTDDDTYELGWIPHNAPQAAFRFVRDDAGLFIPAPPTMGHADLVDAITQTMEYTQEIRTQELVSHLMSTTGASKRAVERAITQCVNEGKIQRKSHGVFQRSSKPKPVN